ncbi:hypothetical protein O6H91_11G112300 [Diphasiastrum complanatum]|uniref:Uncharacterized protein n=1 Tax=Diphasiastrum complanatum TaxID=34168 RepID=A0ACC2CD10_DIPCM|nr:hypothetical protein O6H91_11G112300 [Diphasiastrum complanatum]
MINNNAGDFWGYSITRRPKSLQLSTPLAMAITPPLELQPMSNTGLLGMFHHKKAEETATEALAHGQAAHTNVIGTDYGTVPPIVAPEKPHEQGGLVGKLHKNENPSSSSSSSEDESGVKKERKSKKRGMKKKNRNILPGEKIEDDDAAAIVSTAPGAIGVKKFGLL